MKYLFKILSLAPSIAECNTARSWSCLLIIGVRLPRDSAIEFADELVLEQAAWGEVHSHYANSVSTTKYKGAKTCRYVPLQVGKLLAFKASALSGDQLARESRDPARKMFSAK